MRIDREPGGPPPGAFLLLLSLFPLMLPMIVTMVLWMQTGIWWRFAVVGVLVMLLIYWQLARIFRAQDRRAIEWEISKP